MAGLRQGPEPDLVYEVARLELDLGQVAWTVPSVPVDTLSILNLSSQALLITPLALEGEGSEVLSWSFSDYTEVLPGYSASIPIRPVEDRTLWSSGQFDAELLVEVGAAWNDPSDFDVAPVWFEDQVRATVTVTLRCDVDGDGIEAAACGGSDCDDGGPPTSPWSPAAMGQGPAEGTGNDTASATGDTAGATGGHRRWHVKRALPVLALALVAATGDPVRGEGLTATCGACHAPVTDPSTRRGRPSRVSGWTTWSSSSPTSRPRTGPIP